MHPFQASHEEDKTKPQHIELDESTNLSEAFQGDEALIAKINELNKLRSSETPVKTDQ